MESANRRLNHLASTLGANQATNQLFMAEGTAAASPKSDDDVVIVAALRTPVCRARRGGFKDTHPTDLLATVLKAVVDQTKLDPKLVGDIQVGNVLPPGGGAAQARMAMFLAGYPDTVPVTTINRQCSSGLQAVVNVASAIQSGLYDIGIGAGVESMSLGDMTNIGEVNPKVFENEKARDCLLTMGETSENVATQYGISREKQDKMAFDSFNKALAAQKEGRFKREIVPVKTILKGADGVEKEVVITEDDGPRPTTLEQLKKLRPAFRENGGSTAANSSQVSDGAAAVLLMKRRVAKKLNMPILGKFISYAVVGVPPSVMGIGPAFAIPEALKRANLTINDIDIYEINEAFASQATYCVEKLNIPYEKLNPNGGAIALGHPLGCTGARQIATLFNELHRTKKTYGCVSMCIGTGMGAAGIFQAEF